MMFNSQYFIDGIPIIFGMVISINVIAFIIALFNIAGGKEFIFFFIGILLGIPVLTYGLGYLYNLLS